MLHSDLSSRELGVVVEVIIMYDFFSYNAVFALNADKNKALLWLKHSRIFVDL